jgi:hypothetical protein
MLFSHHRCRVVAWLTLAAALGVLGGCGKGSATAEVTGTITLNGKAPDLDGLQINFVSDAGGPGVAAEVNKDGTFTATGVPVGKVLASLTYASGQDNAAKDKAGEARIKKKEVRAKLQKGEKADGKVLAPDEATATKGAKNPIPEKFLDPRTSGKTLVVEAGRSNTLTWDIRP